MTITDIGWWIGSGLVWLFAISFVFYSLYKIIKGDW